MSKEEVKQFHKDILFEDAKTAIKLWNYIEEENDKYGGGIFQGFPYGRLARLIYKINKSKGISLIKGHIPGYIIKGNLQHIEGFHKKINKYYNKSEVKNAIEKYDYLDLEHIFKYLGETYGDKIPANLRDGIISHFWTSNNE